MGLGIFGLFAVLLLFRVPIAISAGLSSIIYMYLIEVLPLTYGPLVAFQSLDRFALLAVPFFILAGQLMATGGIAKKLLKVADEMLGALPGGYALTTVLASTFFADLSGSGPGTVAAIGTLMIPAMDKQGYRLSFAAAVSACAGCLAVIIPPSNPMVIYGVAGDVSIGKLFLAGFIPGAMVAIGLMIPAYLISKKNGWGGTGKRGNLKSVLLAIWDAKWAILVPIIILGGIYSGVFTPTESAAVTCLYSIIVGLFIYKEFTFKELPNIFRVAALNIVSIMLIIALATLFGQVVTLLGIPMQMAEGLKSISSNPLVIMLLINLFLIFVGMVMDTVAAIVLLAPILLSVVMPLGFDPVHFGIIMIVNLAIGFITPPLGVNLFVANSISQVKNEKVFAAALPFVGSMLLVLLLLIIFPELTLFLPNLFYK